MCNVWHKLKDSSINRINSGKKKKERQYRLTADWDMGVIRQKFKNNDA